jgi:hypothetical protein
MAMLHGTAAPFPAAVTYDVALQGALKSGWIMVSEGPSGAQLKKPKKMRGLDKLCLLAGVAVGLFNVIVGGFLILIAVVDYAVLTKDRTQFLSRETPRAVV